MLAVLLRREGYQVEYLGADLPVEDLVFYAEDVSPAMIILSANAEESARPLYKMQAKLDELPGKPKLGFGGRYFNENQEPSRWWMDFSWVRASMRPSKTCTTCWIDD
jgi:methanogenic corrinoid protein MtbC1